VSQNNGRRAEGQPAASRPSPTVRPTSDRTCAALNQLGTRPFAVQHFINDNRKVIKTQVDKLSSITRSWSSSGPT